MIEHGVNVTPFNTKDKDNTSSFNKIKGPGGKGNRDNYAAMIKIEYGQNSRKA